MRSDAEVSTLVGGREADEHALSLSSTTLSVSSVELDTLDLFRFRLPQLFLLLLLGFLFDRTVCSGAFWLTTVVVSVAGCMSHKAVVDVAISCEEDMLADLGTSSEDSLAGEGVSSEDSLDNSCKDSLAGEGVSSEDSLDNSCEDSLAGEGEDINCDAWLAGEREDKLAGEVIRSEDVLAGIDIGCEGVSCEDSLAGVDIGCEGVSSEDSLPDGTCEIFWDCDLLNHEMVCEHASDLLTETSNSEPLSKSNKAFWKQKVASPFGC